MAIAFLSPPALSPSRRWGCLGQSAARRSASARPLPPALRWGLPAAAAAAPGRNAPFCCQAAATPPTPRAFSSPVAPCDAAATAPRARTPLPSPLVVPPLFPLGDARPPPSAPSRHVKVPLRRRVGSVAAALLLLLLAPSRRAVAAVAASGATAARPAVSVAVEPPPPTRVAVKGGRLAPLRTTALRVVPVNGDAPAVVAAKVAALAVTLFVLAFALMIVVFYGIQDRLVYKPSRVSRGTPADFDMPDFDDVSFCTMDGVEINGWFIRRPGQTYRTARTLVYFHGTDKNASFRLKKAFGFYDKCACNVLLTSYRGYGSSGGSPNEKGMCRDADGAFEYLRARTDIDGGRVWVFGESLGGAVSLHFVKRYEKFVNALVLENTFTSLLDMINREFPFLGVFRYLSRNQWRSTSRIRSLTLPMLFLSGQRDAYIPPDMMKQLHTLAEASSSYTEFVPIRDGTHSRTWTNKNYFTSVVGFMEKLETEGLLKALPLPRETLTDGGDIQFA